MVVCIDKELLKKNKHHPKLTVVACTDEDLLTNHPYLPVVVCIDLTGKVLHTEVGDMRDPKSCYD